MNGGAVRRAGSGSRQLRQVGLGQQRHGYPPRRRSGAGRQTANVSREEARLEMLAHLTQWDIATLSDKQYRERI